MPQVSTGLERWLDEPDVGSARSGARIGILAHAASIDGLGRHAIERLHANRRNRIVRLFAPEHGLWGHEQDMERVQDQADPYSGLPVVSLYGSTRASLRPRREHLADLDAVVCDLQDVGSRYYTFVYTLAFMMEQAAACAVPVVVLDRPNPIGGSQIEGPILREEMLSFVGEYPLPVRHGMTIGELARYFNDSREIGCDLTVIPMQGWSRSMTFEQTGLPWAPPSPNMPSPMTARVYPGGCLVEGTELSEGRGTTTPFELVGAPWIDGHALAAALRNGSARGVSFRAASFRPMFQKHAHTACAGVQVIPRDFLRFRPFETYLEILLRAREQDPERFGWRMGSYEFEEERLAIDLLLGRADLRAMIEGGAAIAELRETWLDELTSFGEQREAYLLYP